MCVPFFSSPNQVYQRQEGGWCSRAAPSRTPATVHYKETRRQTHITRYRAHQVLSPRTVQATWIGVRPDILPQEHRKVLEQRHREKPRLRRRLRTTPTYPCLSLRLIDIQSLLKQIQIENQYTLLLGFLLKFSVFALRSFWRRRGWLLFCDRLTDF